MRRQAVLSFMIPALALLVGCASGPRAARDAVVIDNQRAARVSPNLALGASPLDNWLAERLTDRSAWPSAPLGYRFDEPWHYTQSSVDDFSFRDRNGLSGHYRIDASYRSGVLIR